MSRQGVGVAAMVLALAAAGPAPADDAPADVKVMSFNVRYGTARDGDNHWDKRKAFLAETVKAFGPDLLGTQETLAFQRDYLSEHLPGYAAFAAGRDDGKEKGEMAALFWRADRFDKLAGGHFWLSDTPDVPGSRGWDAALPRVATWVKLKDRRAADAKPVLFVNAHLDHQGQKARVEAAKLLRGRVDDLGKGCPVVVTGDFNAGDGSDPYQALFGPAGDAPSPLADTFRAAHPKREKNEGTFTGFRPDAVGGDRIDWIGATRDWTVRRAGIDRTARGGRVPSDHFPVYAVLGR